MIGTVVNVFAIILGSIIGLLFKKWIRKEYCDRVLKVIGISVLVISVVGIIKAMISINDDNSLSSQYELLLIVVLAIGTLIGEVLKIDSGINKVVGKIENTGSGTITVSNSSSSATVSGRAHSVGGLIGYVSNNSSGTINIKNVFATGDVTGSDQSTGGLIGRVYTRDTSTGTINIENSYSTGNVSGNEGYVGGIVGYLYTSQSSSGTISISNSCSSGNISGENSVSTIAVSEVDEYVAMLEAKLSKRLSETRITVKITDKAKDYIIDASYDSLYGARPLKRFLQSEIETLIAKKIIADNIAPDSEITVDFENGKLKIENQDSMRE